MPPSPDPRAADALARAAAAGPYFAIQLGVDDGPWRPFAQLLDSAVLRENVGTVQRVLAERTRIPLPELDLRACASTHFLGLASRLVAPALGAAALTGHVPTLRLGELRWQRVDGGPVPLAIVDAAGTETTSLPAAAAALHRGVVEPVVAPLVAAFGDTFALSPQVLWGNVASALFGAATMLVRSGAAQLLDPHGVAAAALEHGPLRGMGSWADGGFRRHNCCLFYKIPGGGMCGDCVLISGDDLAPPRS